MVELEDAFGSNPNGPQGHAGSTPAASTKVCSVCERRKELIYFSFKSKSTGQRSAACKQCHAKYSKKHYKANSNKYKERAALSNGTLRIRSRDWVRLYKKDKPCVDCGVSFHHAAMDFDHTGTDKKAGIAVLAARGASVVSLLSEIAKCDLVCANCHRIRTYKRRHFE